MSHLLRPGETAPSRRGFVILRAVHDLASRPGRYLLRTLATFIGAALLASCWAPAAEAYRLTGKRWPGRPATITYWNGTGYDEEVTAAVRAWNTSGVRVRFVRTPRAQARVQMTSYPVLAGILEGYGASGKASLGYSPYSYVRVSRGSKGAAITGVIAHELGHILGLNHDNSGCGLMNTLPWVGCEPQELNCDIVQPDDLRGALKRYGGRARKPRGELCPAAPSGPVITTLPNSYRVQMTFDLPKAVSVGGYGYRVGVGSCPAADTTPVKTETGVAGQSILADVTPDDPGAAGSMLCVRLWSSGEAGRLSKTSTTTTIDYRPDPLPAPASLTGSSVRGGASIQWSPVTHSALLGYEVAYQSGESCPARPSDAPSAQRAGFSAAQATGGLRLSASPGRYCIAVWSRDYFGKLSSGVVTTVVDVLAW